MVLPCESYTSLTELACPHDTFISVELLAKFLSSCVFAGGRLMTVVPRRSREGCIRCLCGRLVALSLLCCFTDFLFIHEMRSSFFGEHRCFFGCDVFFTTYSLTAVNRVQVCYVLSVELPEFFLSLICRSADISDMLFHISFRTCCSWWF